MTNPVDPLASFDAVERLIAERDGRVAWLIAKLKTMRTYKPPTDDRNEWQEIIGWMNILCFDHDFLKRLLPEVDQQTRDLAAARQRADDFQALSEGLQAACDAMRPKAQRAETAERERDDWIATEVKANDRYMVAEARVAALTKALEVVIEHIEAYDELSALGVARKVLDA